ncbi:hypothetical protein NFI96_001937 [Prochilodus magdalenae]|nr:hypothetical protein NFI96_001937 [Prochilodus magdalenae]
MSSRSLLLFITVLLVDSLSADSRIFMSARVGSSAVLPCQWRNVSSSHPHVEWRTISETVFERQGEELYQGEGYKDRVDVPEDKLLKGNCSLVLKNIRPGDAGIYESYLLVRRAKRGLRSRRVLIQSVELSVDGEYELSRTLARPDRCNGREQWMFGTEAVLNGCSVEAGECRETQEEESFIDRFAATASPLCSGISADCLSWFSPALIPRDKKGYGQYQSRKHFSIHLY